MTAYDDLDRTLAAWFESDALPGAPAGRLESTVAGTRRIRPRPTWLAGPGSRWPESTMTVGLGVGAIQSRRAGLRLSMMLLLVLALIALVGGALLMGARLLGPPPATLGDGRLAYVLGHDIFLADSDGGRPVRITNAAAAVDGCDTFWTEGPLWSPDGRHLVYRGGGEGCAQMIFISDEEGQVTASFSGGGWIVSWSPDSTRLSTWVEWGRTIAIHGIDGVRQAELDLPEGMGPTGDYDPVWSPDGRSVLIRLGPPHPSRIWEIPVDGWTPRKLPDADTRSEYDASWSQDGRRVAYVPYLESYSLIVANADGSPIHVLDGAAANQATGPGAGPQYGGAILSRAGDRAAFSVTSGALDLATGATAHELGVVDVATGAVTTVYRPDGFDTVEPIEFSADGDRLLFRRSNAATDSVWSVNVDGSMARQILAGTREADWR